MNNERDFVRALSSFLAEHTEQSSGYLSFLIETFLHGGQPRPTIEPAAREEIKRRLKIELEANNNVPSFLNNYLSKYLNQDTWPSQAALIASRYMRRQAGERFVDWPQRQQFVAELEGEPIRGTELGLRQLLYSQGAGAPFSWRGLACFKAVYDLAIYAMLIAELRPATIIELGSGTGGSALLLADLCTSIGLPTQITSIDTAAVEGIDDPRVTFIRADCSTWLEAAAKSTRVPGPRLLIEDFHGDLAACFGSIDAILDNGDYLVVEDSNPKQSRIAQVIAGRPYLIDSKYTDFFGINCTSAINSIFVKNTGAPAPHTPH